jgi:hypothetical protein
MLLDVRMPPGEFLDKMTILEIKSKRIEDPEKLVNVRRELELLHATWFASGAAAPDVTDLVADLREVNEALWDIEDRIRQKEVERRFDEEFIELARSVYRTNDRRAAIKRSLNLALGSEILEEKSYTAYESG